MITFSSLILKCFLDENIDFLTSAKIQKIQQPTRKELIFQLRNHSLTKKLYINISSDFFHICFAKEENLKKREIEIPKMPPMFCMLLRKYIENAKITRVDVPDYERILELYFENYDELGEKIELCLAVELMGKYSNIILYNVQNGIILGCMHNVGEEKSQVRELSGGLPYVYPPKKEKKDLFNLSKEEFEQTKLTAHNKIYYLTYQILNDANYDYQTLKDILNNPKIYINDELYSFTKIDSSFKETTFNEAIDFYYSMCQEKSILKNLKSNLKNLVTKKIQKQQKQIEKLEFEQQKSLDFEKNKLYGDLILSDIYKIKPGDKTLLATDYQTSKEVLIPLDENLTPSQNAQQYYKIYSKLKTKNEHTKKYIEEAKDYLDYLSEVDLSVDLTESLQDLRDFKESFDTNSSNKKVKQIEKIEKTQINDFEIYIGKNHFQNDYLLSKIASPEDIWLHVKDMPSAHIIIKKREKEIDEQTIFEAAKIVKKLSKAKNSSKVGVIYTQKKFVKKIPKSKYGLVNYREEKELILD